MTKHLLEVNSLITQFQTPRGKVNAVDGLSFHIGYGETVGLVGESGSGKSITSLSILGLIKPPGKITQGSIKLDGEELVGKSKKELLKIRGRKASMIFQEPMTSLNPVLTIGEQIAETVRFHQGMKKSEAWAYSVEMLKKVGIPMPEERAKQYPHQLSGGMRQRVMIAIALCCQPKLLIADEPTTALDVTSQAQILELIKELNLETGTGVLMVTHDLGVVAETCERVLVMYAGKIVEQAYTKDLFRSPMHPYTEALLKSIPTIGGERKKLFSIPGNVPSPTNLPTGCRFHTRCPYVTDRCRNEEPPLQQIDQQRLVSCWNVDQVQMGKVENL